LRKWLREEVEFWSSPAGIEMHRNTRQYGMVFETDGHFKINDVAPGQYLLTMGFSSKMTSGLVKKMITIPDEQSGSNEAPVDLGVLELVVQDEAPPRSAQP
jgi:hypothetical protein